MAVRIKLSGQRGIGKVVLVDEDVYEWAKNFRWCESSDGYAKRGQRIDGKDHTIYLHREIMGMGPGDPEVDHENGDRLNCTRGNLRIATDQENAQNRKAIRGNFRGVSFRRNRWRGTVKIGNKQLDRHFRTEEEAARWVEEQRRELMPFARSGV